MASNHRHLYCLSLVVVHRERENLCSLVTHPRRSVLCGFDTVTCGQEEVSIFDIDGHGERASFGHMIEMYMYIQHRNDIACRTNTVPSSSYTNLRYKMNSNNRQQTL